MLTLKKKLTPNSSHKTQKNKSSSIDIKKSSPISNMENKRLNELFIGAFSELNDIFMRKGEPFRARAYKRAEETILMKAEDITDYSQMEGYPNMGPVILSKMKELQETGTLRLLEKERSDPLQLFTQIHGIGPKKAEALIQKDIKTIEQLRQNQDMLNDNQKIGLKYLDDISKRIPRSVIDTYKTVFDEVIQSMNDHNIVYDIVGSYRRGTASSGDIDIIVSHKEDKNITFSELLSQLKEKNIIVEFLTKGKVKSLTITKLPNDIARRVDFLYAPPKEYAFSQLYFTGSKGFNTVMRHRALQFGYTLNEHGISKMNDKVKGEKIDFIDFPDEKSIFDFFKMTYKEPKERKDGRAVVSSTGTPVISKPIKMVKKTKKSKKTEQPSKVVGETKKNEEIKVEEPIKVAEDTKKTKKVIKKTKSKWTRTKFIKEFRSKGINLLDSMTEDEIIAILKDANDAFFNDMSFINDNEYDIIKEYTQNKFPSNVEVQKIGAPVIERNKVKLPYFMGSMDKIKPDTNVIDKWKQKYKGSYIISAKLDGVSGLYSTEKGVQKLYTRGDGRIGQDISHFIPYLKLPKDENITIRGEFIINRHTFEKKYGKQFANPRNFVSGLINAKSIDIKKFADIEFVAYEVIVPDLIPEEQMKLLSSLNVTPVIYESHTAISNEKLSDILVQWRNHYQYESDGIIVTDNNFHARVNKNPEHSFAFKMVLSDQIAEAKVVDVIWSVSKDGLLKPKIQIEPIVLGGATIQYATAHNAAMVVSNKLGIGAIVKIIRSGDVIPYIMETVVPAEEVKMPEVEYTWNETHVDIELADKKDNEEMIHKRITAFFTGVGVDGLSKGNIARIMKSGYNTISKIVHMSKENLIDVDGFKEKMATKIHDSIREKLKEATVTNLISSSNMFGAGFGERKAKLILDEYPTILTANESKECKIETLANVKGMATKTAAKFVEQIPEFIQFLEDIGLKYKLETKQTVEQPLYQTDHPLYSKSIVFTGVRDKDLMQLLEQTFAVSLASSVSKNTFAVITKSKTDESSKLTKARSLNIPIYEVNEFRANYSITN